MNINSFFKGFIEGFRTLFGLNHEEQMDEAYNALTNEEREQLDRMVSYSNK